MRLINDERGYIFIIVVWTLVILGVIFTSMIDEINLDNMLISNDFRERKLYQATISAVMHGIHKLKEDQTIYDSYSDEWVQGYKLESEDGIVSEVKMRDVGSKLNINYCNDQLFKEFDWWEKEIGDTVNQFIIPDLVFIKETLGDNYAEANKFFTTYGNFNLNADPLNGLEKLLKYFEVNETQIELIENNLKKFRNEEKILKDVEQLPLLIDGLDLITFEKIQPFLTTEGRININFVDADILDLIFIINKVKRENARWLLIYLDKNEIKKLEQIKDKVSEEAWGILNKYFTVSSNYIEIEVNTTSIQGNHSYNIKAVIERKYVDEEWQLEIIQWVSGQQNGE